MSEQQSKTGRRLTSTQIILIVGIVAIVAAVAVVGTLLLKRPAAEAAALPVAAPGTGNLVVDENFNAADMRAKAADNMFEVKMNAQWNFPDGAGPSTDAYVANSNANKAPFYFEVLVRDTEEVLYTSPVIPLGSAVREFKLDKPLEKGDYDCICRYNVLNEDQTIDASVAVTVKIKVG